MGAERIAIFRYIHITRLGNLHIEDFCRLAKQSAIVVVGTEYGEIYLGTYNMFLEIICANINIFKIAKKVECTNYVEIRKHKTEDN